MANAQRLLAALARDGIGYSHHKELAPTTDLREAQYRVADRLAGEPGLQVVHLLPAQTTGSTGRPSTGPDGPAP